VTATEASPHARADAAPPPDRSREVLNFLHQVLVSGPDAATSLPGLLEQLARAFAAFGAGVTAADSGAGSCWPVSAASCWPWQDRPEELLARVRGSRTAIALHTTAGSWLLTAISPALPAAWLLWVRDVAGRSWTVQEQAALTLAGQVLAGTITTAPAESEWARQLDVASRQRRLEDCMPVVSRLAHDFGNLLTAISGFSELALKQTLPNAPGYEYLQEIQRAAHLSTGLIQQLRVFSRRGTTTTAPATSLARVVLAEVARRRADWGAAVRCQVQLDPALPPVAASPEQLTQLVGVFLDNAREALTEVGTITVAARVAHLAAADCLGLFGGPRPGRCVELTVSDNGSGISPEVQSQLLAGPFFSTRPRHRGLGLAMAFSIVRRYQGGFRLEPASPHGTSARVFLPLAGEDAPPATACSPANLGANHPGNAVATPPGVTPA
jgi:signal transduction histidine kinase